MKILKKAVIIMILSSLAIFGDLSNILDTGTLTASPSENVWKDQVIVLDDTSSVTISDSLLIDNCTITGSLEVNGHGTIEIVNTNWMLPNDSNELIINLMAAYDINLEIRNSTLVSNGTYPFLFYLPKNTSFYAENSVLEIPSNEISISCIIHLSDGEGSSVTITDCDINGGVWVLNGYGTGRINVTKSRWEQEIGGIFVSNMSSVVINKNVFDMNVGRFIYIEEVKNTEINDNIIKLNTSKTGYTQEEGDNWITGQDGIMCSDPLNNIQIRNNSFSNLGTAIKVVGGVNQTVVIEDNIFDGCHYKTIMLQSKEGSNKIIDNIFHQCLGRIHIVTSEKTKVENNVFNGSSIEYYNTEIEISGNSDTNISNNVFVGGIGVSTSILAFSTNRTRIRNNSFYSIGISTIYFNKDVGIEIFENVFINEYINIKEAKNGIVFLNKFLNRSAGYEYDSTNIKWDNGTHGNYWSQYEIIDEDNDLIGDNPYFISDGAVDYYPLTLQFFSGKESNPTVTDSSLPMTSNNQTVSTFSSKSKTQITTFNEISPINYGLVIVLLALVSRRRSKKENRKE